MTDLRACARTPGGVEVAFEMVGSLMRKNSMLFLRSISVAPQR
jgi:hypothetical protein